MPRKRTATTKPGLTRDRVVAAGVAVADEGGVASVTMRRVAESLGVEAMSLYHHVRNKDDLLDGMVDAVFAEIDLPGPDDGWRSGQRARAVSARAAMARHPWALGLMDSRTSPGEATMRHHDAVLANLRRAGFPVAAAALAVAVLDSYVYGFALQEASLPFDDDESLAELVAGIFERHEDESHPHLAEMAREHALVPGYTFGQEFEPGLDLVLDALAGLAGR